MSATPDLSDDLRRIASRIEDDCDNALRGAAPQANSLWAQYTATRCREAADEIDILQARMMRDLPRVQEATRPGFWLRVRRLFRARRFG